MHNDFTFPLALCRAQWSVGLHTLAVLETCGAQCLSLGAHMLQDAVRTLKAALNARAVRHSPKAGARPLRARA
ncbi:hypothetical protein LJR260_006107 [Variovorax paradoxus]|uniref:hypothetical protein n=1 Tax=Variovorax paradoxus TaxID=34073 RepID=UPI003ECD3771